MPDDKQQRARRRARNSQAPDLFRRAAETDTTLRKSTATEAPSSRRGAAANGAPSSRRGSQAAKRSRDATGTSPEEALELEAQSESEQKSGKISERRPKTTAPDSSSEGSPGRAAVLPGDEVSLAPPAPVEGPSRRGALIGAVLAMVGVVGVLLLWRFGRAPDEPVSPSSTSVEAPAAATQVALTPTAAPEPPAPEVAAPAPTATAAPEDADATAKDGKKKKKKKPTAATAKPPATSAPTAAPTVAPAFQFQFE